MEYIGCEKDTLETQHILWQKSDQAGRYHIKGWKCSSSTECLPPMQKVLKSSALPHHKKINIHPLSNHVSAFLLYETGWYYIGWSQTQEFYLLLTLVHVTLSTTPNTDLKFLEHPASHPRYQRWGSGWWCSDLNGRCPSIASGIYKFVPSWQHCWEDQDGWPCWRRCHWGQVF